jgi:2-methylcitrate dehydratase PrpD
LHHADSLSIGLVELARSGTGAMVKRLHVGCAAEGGVLAANPVTDGFTGPATVREGDCGFPKVFCNEWTRSFRLGCTGAGAAQVRLIARETEYFLAFRASAGSMRAPNSERRLT